MSYDDRVQEFAARKALAAIILKQQESDLYLDRPLSVTNLSSVASRLELWRKLLPRVQPFYAIKCNDNPRIIKLLARLGCGFEIASEREIEKVAEAWEDNEKLNKDRLRHRAIFGNPCKSICNLKAAKNAGVDLMAFDNSLELHKIKEHFPDVRLLLRILPPAAKAIINLREKFGANKNEAVSLMSLAKSLQLNIVGLSFHVGTGCGEADAFARAVYDAKPLFDHLKELFPEANLLDIGGGFPGGGTNWDEASADTIKFEEICHHLTVALDECFPASGGVNIVAEPGRYMVESAVSVAVSVIAKRASSNESSVLYYVNDGIFGMFSSIRFESTIYQPWPLTRAENEENRRFSTIFGPTCCGIDKIGHNYKLPEMQIGDWLLFHHVGAYSSTVMTDFNSIVEPLYFCMFTCRSDCLAKTQGHIIIFWEEDQKDFTVKRTSAEEISAELETNQCSPLLVRDNENPKKIRELPSTTQQQNQQYCDVCSCLMKTKDCQTSEELLKKMGYLETIIAHLNVNNGLT